VQSRVRQFLGGSPTGLAESSSQYSYGLVICLRLLPTLSRDNAVTTFDYRLVTIAWTGLSPDNSNAFTGALGNALCGVPGIDADLLAAIGTPQRAFPTDPSMEMPALESGQTHSMPTQAWVMAPEIQSHRELTDDFFDDAAFFDAGEALV